MKSNIIIQVNPAEIVQLIDETAGVEGMEFHLERAPGLLPNALHAVTELDFSDVWEFLPPETGRIALYNYVAQKMESVPPAKKTVEVWLKAFYLEDHADTLIAALPRQAHLKLQLLLAVLEQHGVILIRSSELLGACDAVLWSVKHFLLHLDNPVLQPAFVVCDADLTPGMAFSMERLLVVENNVVETLSVSI